MPELQRQKRLEAIALDPDRIEREKRDRFTADRRALAEQYAARLFALDERTRRTIEAIASTPPVLVEEFAPSVQLPAPPAPDIGPWQLADGTPADGAHVDLPEGSAPTLSFTPAVFFSVLTPDCAGPAALATVLSARFSVRDDYYPAADYEVLLHADEAECDKGTWFGHVTFPQRSYPPGEHTIVYRVDSPGVVGAQLVRRFSIAQLEAPPPPPPPRFHWTGAECVVAADGEYATLAECSAAHPPQPVPVYGWHWDGAQCVYAVNGEFGTKEQCQSAHPPPPPPPPPSPPPATFTPSVQVSNQTVGPQGRPAGTLLYYGLHIRAAVLTCPNVDARSEWYAYYFQLIFDGQLYLTRQRISQAGGLSPNATCEGGWVDVDWQVGLGNVPAGQHTVGILFYDSYTATMPVGAGDTSFTVS